MANSNNNSNNNTNAADDARTLFLRLCAELNALSPSKFSSLRSLLERNGRSLPPTLAELLDASDEVARAARRIR